MEKAKLPVFEIKREIPLLKTDNTPIKQILGQPKNLIRVPLKDIKVGEKYTLFYFDGHHGQQDTQETIKVLEIVKEKIRFSHTDLYEETFCISDLGLVPYKSGLITHRRYLTEEVK